MVFTIIIEGTGPHHTTGATRTSDANRQAANLVAALRAAGCSVSSAAFRYGTRDAFSDENILDPVGYTAALEAELATTPLAPVGTTAEGAPVQSTDGGIIG